MGTKLETCANGCDAPPHPPSEVLCKRCFDALDRKMHSLLGGCEGDGPALHSELDLED